MPAIAPPPPASPPAAPPSASPPPAAPAAPPDELYSAQADAEIDALEDGAPPPAKPPKQPQQQQQQPPEQEEEEQETPPQADQEIEQLDVVENPEAKKLDKTQPDPQQQQPEKPLKMRDLKVVYERVKAEKQQLETKLADATKRLEQASKANPDEIKTLTERLEAAEKGRKELESELRYLNYQKHPEFKERFEKPYVKAWEAALADLAELTVVDAEGKERPAGKEDMIELANMPYGQAVRRAEELFGPVVATQIMAHRKSIIDLSRAQQQALEESRTAATERDKTRMLEAKAQQEKLRKVWESENETYASRFPRWFKPIDGDQEGNAVLERGFAEVDRFFNDMEMPAEERVKAHVRLRAKAANHDRLALRLKRATERIKKLQADLAAYEGAEPPAGKTRRTSGKPSGDIFETADREIEALDER